MLVIIDNRFAGSFRGAALALTPKKLISSLSHVEVFHFGDRMILCFPEFLT
jgi:hypothetical protein